MCKFDYFKVGFCGVLILGVEIKFDYVKGCDKDGEGEICFCGCYVMMGYFNNLVKI